MRVKSLFAMFSLAMLCLSGCALGTPGSGISATQTRDVDVFHSISIAGSGQVNVKVGPPQSVQVTLDDNLIDRVETEVRDGQLFVSVKGSWSTRLGLEIDITVPELIAFHGSGSPKAMIEGLSSETFSTSITGSGEIVAVGIANTTSATIAGSGDIDLSGLKASKANAIITGSGKIDIHATTRATATIAGSGAINVHGNPDSIAESITGSGSVDRF